MTCVRSKQKVNGFLLVLLKFLIQDNQTWKSQVQLSENYQGILESDREFKKNRKVIRAICLSGICVTWLCQSSIFFIVPGFRHASEISKFELCFENPKFFRKLETF